MSFATLEEAWGVPSFGAAPPPLVGGGGDDAGGYPPARAAHNKRGRGRPPRRKATAPGMMPGLRGRPPMAEASPVGDFAPAPQLTPRREDDDTEMQNVRRFLARTYARFGAAGLARLLPREAARELGGGGGGHKRSRMWDEVVRFVSCPEKMLFVLLCAFVLLVAWDSWRGDHAATAAATMAAMHMAPFATPAAPAF